MTKNNRTINVIVRRLAAAFVSLAMTSAVSVAPVFAESHSFHYLENGDAAIYDHERECYVSMNAYHEAYGYVYSSELDAYVLRSEDGSEYICSCPACNYWKEGHNVVIPAEETSETASDAAGNDAGSSDAAGSDQENASQEQSQATVYMTGTELTDNNSGSGWSFDKASNTLTLDSYTYEGTGLFGAAEDGSADDEESSDNEAEDNQDEADSDDEDTDDGADYEDDGDEYVDYEDDDDDSTWVEGDEDGDGVSDEWMDAEDAGNQAASTGEADGETASEPVNGVIRSNAGLTLRLNGESHITVTDEGSDASYAVNVPGELKIEGDGVLYVKSATEEKVYGNEPEETAPAGEVITNNNNNDIDNTQTVNEAPVDQTVNEAPVDQTVNEAPVTQSVNDGDVNISNNNNISLPDSGDESECPITINEFSFETTVDARQPLYNAVEESVRSEMQRRHPEVAVKSSEATNAGSTPVVRSDSAEPTSNGAATPADGTPAASTPKTADPMDIGWTVSLILTAVGGAVALAIIIRKRRLGLM